MKTKRVQPGPELEAFRQDLLKLLDRHLGQQPADRILATAAYAVGQIMALQDAGRFTIRDIERLVIENMAEGNRAAIEAYIAESGGRN